jgi:hypothetical protein
MVHARLLGCRLLDATHPSFTIEQMGNGVQVSARLQEAEPARSQRLSAHRSPQPVNFRFLFDAASMPAHALGPASLMALQRAAGNQAVAGLLGTKVVVQRDIGWSDASQEGYAWNAKDTKGKAPRRDVGRIKRLPFEGLKVGLETEKASVWVPDSAEETERKNKGLPDKQKKKKTWHLETESTRIKSLSSESATDKAIAVVHSAIDPNQDVDVLIFLHGYTESAERPFAGWRTLSKDAAKTKDKRLAALRKGDDAADVAPVRDVALDQAEQQMEESHGTQTIMVLPQGGLHSQFGPKGDYSFDASKYADAVVDRLVSETVLAKRPKIARVSMAGHSGAGSTLTRMAEQSATNIKEGKPATISGDLVLFDAINQGQAGSYADYAKARLDADLAVLQDHKVSDEAKLKYLGSAPKIRGYHTATYPYPDEYKNLQTAIDDWFVGKAAVLGPATDLEPLGPCLYANFYVKRAFDLDHEELMRGVHAGTARGTGEGNILDALKALHAGAPTPGSCLSPEEEKGWFNVLKRMERQKPKPPTQEKKPAGVAH